MSSLNGVWYTSSMAPLRILGSTRSFYFLPCEVIWSILCFTTLLILFDASLITPEATLAAWLTTSLPAYGKSYLFKKPPVSLFHLCWRTFFIFFFFFGSTYFWFDHKKRKWCPFLIQIEFSKYLLIISTHKWYLPWKMSLISLFLNLDVTNTFEFVGKKAVT